MSEHSRRQLGDTFNSITFGSVTLVYNEELLDGIGTSLTDDFEASPAHYMPLALPYFSHGTAQHIGDASFGLKKHSDDESLALGHITYHRTKTSPHKRYRGSGPILQDMCNYLKSQLLFSYFDLSLSDNELIATNIIHTFRFTATNNPNSVNEVMLTTETRYDSVRPASEDILMAASAWAHVCEYVVRLGAEATPHKSETIIALGQVKEYPSDIEIGLAQELANQYMKLGAAATLPHFDEADILSLDTQRLIAANNISPDELVNIAESIVQKKRKEYATLEVMSEITQSDIVNALREALEKRI